MIGWPRLRRRHWVLALALIPVHLTVIPFLAWLGLGPRWAGIAWLMLLPVIGVAAGAWSSGGRRWRKLGHLQATLLVAHTLGLSASGWIWLDAGLLRELFALIIFATAFLAIGWSVARLGSRFTRRDELVLLVLLVAICLTIFAPYYASAWIAGLVPESQGTALAWLLGGNPSMAVLEGVAGIDALSGFPRAYMEKFTIASDLNHSGLALSHWSWFGFGICAAAFDLGIGFLNSKRHKSH